MVKSFKALFLILGFITACMPIMIEAPLVSSVSIVSDQLIVTGQGFININGLTLSDPQTGLKKTFKVSSVSGSQIVGTAVNPSKVPVPSLLNLIIDSAQGQTTYPVNFTLQNNAVTNPTIKNGAISPEKFKGVSNPNPPDQTVLTWSQPTQSFMFTTVSGGGGSSGVSQIVLGPGITGAPNAASGSVPISVNIGTTGAAAPTIKIPYFNSLNKIVLDSSASPLGALTGLSFLDGSKNFDIINDNSLRIDSNSATDLLVLDVNGTLNLKGPVTVGNLDVCLSSGNCTSVSGISVVTATPPLVAAQVATGTINISPGTVNTANNLVQLEGSGKLPAVDGSLVTNIPTMASATAANQIIISTGPNKQLTTTMYPIPSAIGATGTVLKSDGTSAVWQAETTGTGDVVGPATATLNSIARYESGKIIKESGIIIDDTNNISGVAQLNTKVANNLVVGTGLGTDRNLPIYVGLSPTEIEDSGISLDNIPTMASGATAGFQPILSAGLNKSQIAAPYTLPDTTCLPGEVLKWNATGFNCQADNIGSGDVVGPATSTFGNIATFGASGKIIQDSGIAVANVPTMVDAAASSNTIILSAEADKTLKTTDYTIPASIGSPTYVLKSDGTNVVWGPDDPGTQSLIAPTRANARGFLPMFFSSDGHIITDSDIEAIHVPEMELDPTAANQIIISTGAGKHLTTTLYPIPTAIGASGTVLKSDGTSAVWQADIAGTGDVVGPATSAPNTLAQFSDSTGKIIKGTTWTVPNNIGGLGQYLTVSGGQDLVWTTFPTGLVYVGGPIVADNLPKFGGSAGTQIVDSGLATVNVATMAAAAVTSNTIILSGGADKTLKNSGISIDGANNISGVAQLNTKVANNLVTGTGIGVGGNIPVYVGISPTEIVDSGILLTNIPTMASNATGAFHPILSGGNNKSQIAAPYTFPNTSCVTGEVLKWNATGFDCQSDIVGTGTSTSTVLTQWAAGKDYKVGEIINSGSDKNWLFKVIRDHTSVYEPADVKAGNLLAMSPPIITTGIQGGGTVSLAGNIATIQAGTGFISKYNTSPSPYPLITIVEWATQSIPLPATGLHTLFINENGILESVPGLPTKATDDQDSKISVGLIDMNLGKAYDRETYPTNPVGQLRALSFFFGGMTKGLVYTATGLSLARSAYEEYFWGANSSNPHDPNTRDVPALSPVTFYEYTQTGAVLPASQNNTLKNNVYDKNGTLTTMGNNKWGFVRIYSTLGVDDYVMYSQSQYQSEADAKKGAMNTFIKPIDLELTKFSSWFVFEKGDPDFSDNPITTCEPFGCDKIGTSAGGGGGNVLGPINSTAGNLAVFADSSGKILVQSLFAPPAATGTVGQVLTSNGDGTTKWGTLAVAPTRASLPSDKKLKKDIKDLPEVYIKRLMELRPVSFVWRDTLNPDIGFIAQEVSQVFPYLVENNDDILGINYSKLVVPLVKAFQEQYEETKAFREKVQKDEQTIKMLLERIERLEKIIGEEAKK